jgi:pimeloyl-ACP methyl ester carboxylesterase
MPQTTRLLKSLLRLLLPACLLLAVAIAGGSVWLVYSAARPVKSTYLVTPDKYGQLSTRAAQVTEEAWTNKDGSQTRGWLLRGAEGAPAVILLHKYGADRSYTLNLGVKLNESTNFTVLMPDQRAHGEKPSVQNASFGGCEAEDIMSAVDFVKNLKTANQIKLAADQIGIFGVEMGAMVALRAAAADKSIKALVLDSIPQDSDEVLQETVSKRYPFASFATTRLAKFGTYLYFMDGCYRRDAACDSARQIQDRDVMLLAGLDAQEYQGSTAKLGKCLPNTNRIQSKTDLSPSGYSIINASMSQSETYDQRLIDFFRASLSQ